jgi:DNA-3-methyladenine glycosylase II
MTRLKYLRDDPPLKRDLKYLLTHDRVFAGMDFDLKSYNRKVSALSFASLIKTISGQQISTKAAASVYARVKDVCKGYVTAKNILALSDTQLRAAGFSAQKIRYAKELAKAVQAKEFSVAALKSQSDEAVIDSITKLHGFGVWSAQMVLIFALCRRDVWPVGDLGVQIGAGYYLKRDKLSAKDMESFGTRFAGRRTAAALLLWYLKAHTENKRCV